MHEYFYTFLISITPVLELRASIPVAILKFNLSPTEAIIISTLGGIVAAAFCLWILPHAIYYLEKFLPFTKPLIDKILSHTRKKHGKKLSLMGDFFLIVLVAIPLPGSGVFTGSLVAYLFGIKFHRALILISIGTFISALIVASLTVGGESLWEFFSVSASEDQP